MTRITLMTLLLLFLAHASARGQQSDEFVRPIGGSVVLHGSRRATAPILDVFLRLAGPRGAHVAVVAAGKSVLDKQLAAGGALSVRTIAGKAKTEAAVGTLLESNAVWFEGPADALRQDELFVAAVRNLLARGGVVGGGRDAVEALAGASKSSLQLLPHSVVEAVTGRAAAVSGEPVRIVRPGDGRVAWQIPPATALVVHGGRKVAAYGDDHVLVRVPAHDGWPERKRMIQAQESLDAGRRPSYEIDLLGWVRSAQDRRGPVFPTGKEKVRKLSKGTMVLSGGGKLGAETLERFIAAAGGKEARFVCIPSADHFDADERVKSFSAGKLAKAGCANVEIVHVVDPEQAERDARILAALREADGVWIDGGRTYRIIDAFGGTRAGELLFDVLKRGGVVGGSSAGCQVPGEMLVRGNPRSNGDLIFPGYTRGLGLLGGVVIDAHFKQREREEEFRKLVEDHPNLLGIGIDADTAIVIERDRAEVVGPHVVSFFDASKGVCKVFELKAGETFDLIRRKPRR